VEGYVESIFGGILVARNLISEDLPTPDKIDFIMENKAKILLPETTMTGQLQRHLITPTDNFQPMNANFGLLPPLTKKIRDKKLKKQKMAERSIYDLKQFLAAG